MGNQARYLPDRIVLPLSGLITRDEAFRVRADIEVALDYYRYERIEIVIDSPGGEWFALEGILAELGRCQQEHGMTIGTRVVGEAASAAAFVLAAGTVGERSAAPSSRILLHEPRAVIGADGPRVWTRSEIALASQMLDGANERLVSGLSRHVWRGLPENGSLEIRTPGGARVAVQSETELCRTYAMLFAEERWLTPDEALDLKLVDRIDGRSPARIQDPPRIRSVRRSR